MSNLRDLLGIVSEDTLKAGAAPDDVTKIARLPSEGYCVQYITAYCGATCQSIIQITTTCSTLTGVLLMAPVISFLRSGAAVAAAVLPAAVHEAFLLDRCICIQASSW